MAIIPPSLIAAEENVRGAVVVASVVRRRTDGPLSIVVRIAGVMCRVRIRDASTVPNGVGVFALSDATEAVYLRPASVHETRLWFDTLPAVRRLLLHRGDDSSWTTAPAAPVAGEIGSVFDRIIPVYKAPVSSDGAMFDEIIARYDGIRLWDDGRAFPGNADRALALRRCAGMTPPCPESDLSIPGLTPAERKAYAGVIDHHRQTVTPNARERQVFDDIRRAGGEPVAFIDHGDTAEVVYLLNGREFRHLINPTTLFLISSGICLSGQDHHFDVVGAVRVMSDYLRRSRR